MSLARKIVDMFLMGFIFEVSKGSIQESCQPNSLEDGCQDVHSPWTKQTQYLPSYKCVAVLTGYPELRHLRFVSERILMQLSQEFHVSPEHVHVFCQGQCNRDTFGGLFDYNFHSLNNRMDRTLYKGFIIAENYKLLFHQLFNAGEYNYSHCLILEDDLILSPDALTYLDASIEIMHSDPTIFTVSLYNDNSYPWCSSNYSFVRRIDHFSGLGFLMHKQFYVDFVIPNWDDRMVWDNNLQAIMAKYDMSSIQPEVSRVLHVPYQRMVSSSESRIPFDKYTAQMVSHDHDHMHFNVKDLQREAYDKYIEDFISSATAVEYLEDAGFYQPEDTLIYVGCEGERPCIDNLLRNHGLTGAGLGHMLRGAYRGTVFLRVYKVLVLIVPKSSPFYKYVNGTKTGRDVLTRFHHLEFIARESRGTAAHIESEYKIVSAVDQLDCSRICEAHSLECSRAGLWLLNENCDILRHFVKDCEMCDQDENRRILAGPMIERRTDGDVLVLGGSKLHLHCHGGGTGGQRRICACV